MTDKTDALAALVENVIRESIESHCPRGKWITGPNTLAISIKSGVLQALAAPAEGDGAVAEVIDALGTWVLIPQWIGTAPAPVLPIGTRLYTRPSAAAAVPDDEATQSPEQLAQWLDAKYARHHEDEDRQAAAMLRKLAALAQQEPRHDALADDEAASA